MDRYPGTIQVHTQESITQTIALPVVTGCTLSLLVENYPGGLRISGDNLLGTPFEVNYSRTFTFLIRAIKDNVKEDMTLKIPN